MVTYRAVTDVTEKFPFYGVPPARDPGRSEEWSVTVNYGLMLTSGAKTKVTTRFLVKNYPYDMFGRYSRYIVVT